MATGTATAKTAAKKLGDWKNVKVEIEDRIAWVTLNRPEKRNAMNPPLNDDTRNGCWSGATCPPQGDPSGSPVPGTTTGRVRWGSIHATNAPFAEPV